MSANIVDVDAFTSPVVAPTDGDALTAASVIQAIQPLSNRTRNNKNRIDALVAANAFGRYAVSGSPASGAKFTLTQIAANELTLGSDEVTIVPAGLYLVSLHCSMTRNIADDGAGTADGAYVAVGIYADAVEVAAAAPRRFVDEVAISVDVVCSAV